MRFSGSVELGGRTATGIEVPAEVVDELGGGKKPPVTVTVNGHSYRTTVAVRSGRYLVPLSAENRAAAAVAAGDPVQVEITLDTAPREVRVPVDLAEALRAEPSASASFDRLSHSNRQRLVLAVESAKAADTRQRRIAKTVSDLALGKA